MSEKMRSERSTVRETKEDLIKVYLNSNSNGRVSFSFPDGKSISFAYSGGYVGPGLSKLEEVLGTSLDPKPVPGDVSPHGLRWATDMFGGAVTLDSKQIEQLKAYKTEFDAEEVKKTDFLRYELEVGPENLWKKLMELHGRVDSHVRANAESIKVGDVYDEMKNDVSKLREGLKRTLDSVNEFEKKYSSNR